MFQNPKLFKALLVLAALVMFVLSAGAPHAGGGAGGRSGDNNPGQGHGQHGGPRH